MKNKRIFGMAEVAFDFAYLLTMLILGCFLLTASHELIGRLFGAMAIILMLGDCFHLVPRMGCALFQKNVGFSKWLGRGKLFTSIGMTIFYVLLWNVLLFSAVTQIPLYFTVLVYIVAVTRILLVLMPQNTWEVEKQSAKWVFLRNSPFILLGLIVTTGFFALRAELMPSIQNMWLAIVLSFAFYLPVVFCVKKYPMIGMLMLPKSAVYIWIITMGL